MKLVIFIKPVGGVRPPPWADLVFKVNVNSVREALPSVLGHPDSVLLLRSDVKVTDKNAVVKFFSSFKTSAVVKYGNQEELL